MGKKLVIVESPSKSKTIEKYLGKDYKVVSSLGHIRDLSTSGKYGFGVDLEDHFKPDYKIIKGKKKLVTELKKEVKASDFVYLATDPDREGEAISWHLYDALGLKNNDYERIVFNEITKDVILNSFSKARKIDDNLVKSQEARRILDRIIGFRLSKLMQSKTEGKSAGRVQSVALKLIVDREREIQAFNVEKYYEIDAYFDSFDAKLDSYCHEKVEISTKEDADRILGELDKTFVIEDVSKKKKDKKSKFPFTTSTLQQEASNKLNFTSKKTMSIAQKLYEGISLKDETVGLITYMRTDSIRMSDEFVKNTYGYIKNTYGENYVGYVKKSKKTENVQDAHEAIRPTSIFRKPEDIREYLSNDEYKLYHLIYYRALASLMKDAMVEATSVTLLNHDYRFKTSGQILLFDGYLKVYSCYEDSNDKILPELVSGNQVVSNEIKIALGDLVWYKLLERFYDDFEPKVEIAFKEMEKKAPEETGEMCPQCGNPLVIKQSRYGKFVACSNYPECKYIKSNEEKKEVKEIMKCPECDGMIVEKVTRRGKIFYGCNHYPKCKVATWDKPTGELCSQCGSILVETKDGIKCSKCDSKK